MTENRAFKFLPSRLKTPYNKRSMSVTDDVLFEPENFGIVEGQIGDSTGLTERQLAREPFIAEIDDERKAYQLSVAVTSRAGGEATGNIETAAFYTDLIRQIRSNGGLVDDHSRLFASGWSAWAPPIDYDRWVNFARYYWTGPGDSRIQGEYITKDPDGSQTVLYTISGINVQRVLVPISKVAHASFPGGSTVGQLLEDGTDPMRRIYRWNGSEWRLVHWVQTASIPSSGNMKPDLYYYVTSSSHIGNRPVLFEYSDKSGRWIVRLPVISSTEPTNAPLGMIWEDSRLSPNRRFLRRIEGGWEPITWDAHETIKGRGPGSHGDFVYITKSVSDIADGWAKNNWWRHYEDLSETDRQATTGKQGVRPILQFWSGIQAWPGNNRIKRHDEPRFEVFAYEFTSGDILPASSNWSGNTFQEKGGCKLISYSPGIGQDDPIIGFPVSLNDTSEFIFDVNLERDTFNVGDEAVIGYRFYKDENTGFHRTIWAPANSPIMSTKNEDGVWEVPRSLTDNPDHEILDRFSRSETIFHFMEILRPFGTPLGANSFRWSDQDPTENASIIDPHASLMRSLSMLQDPDLDFPEAIRTMSREMTRLRAKFLDVLTAMYNGGEYTTPDDQLAPNTTMDEFLDGVLTHVLVGKDPSSPFWFSSMGTYIDVITGEETPITFPPSVARTGACPVYYPEKLEDGSIRLHDGVIIPAYGDIRDDVILTLEMRFFNSIPEIRRTESLTSSARINSVWSSQRYVGNLSYPIDYVITSVVDDHNNVTPSSGMTVFSIREGRLLEYDGARWLVIPTPSNIKIEDSLGNLWFYNGFSIVDVSLLNKPMIFDYSSDEHRVIMKKEFDRWVINNGLDYQENTTFDPNDSFTWNYSGSGLEGHYTSMYERIYGTERPHTHSWEICGFSIEPEWWRTKWVPTSIDGLGNPRYASSHNIWNDLRNAASFPIEVEPSMVMHPTVPIPVSEIGDLLDPMAIGLLDPTALSPESIRGRWEYGDGGPVERAFLKSTDGAFASALASFLMKPTLFVEGLWSDFVRPIGTPETVWRGPLDIDVNTYRRSKMSESSVHMDFINGQIVPNPGVNSWISETLRYYGSDPITKFGNRVRSASVNLAWRCSGFINRNRTTVRTISGVPIPFEDLYTIVHQSLPRENRYHSGVNVVREGTGYRLYGYNSANPVFTISVPALPSKGGLVTLEETYTSQAGQRDFTLTKFTLGDSDVGRFLVTVNGRRVDESRVIRGQNSFSLTFTPNEGSEVLAELMVSTGSPATNSKWFVIGGKRFEYHTVSSGHTEDVRYGSYFESNADLVKFFVNHGRYLYENGWRYGDPETSDGSDDDWLGLAQRFTAWSESGREDGEIFVDVPSGAELRLELSFGNLMNVERIANGSYSVLDIGAYPIRPEDLNVFRINDFIEVKTVNNQNEIYGLNLGINEIEHVLVINNQTKFGDLIYDPVTSLRQKRLSLKTYRSKDWKGRHEAPGYIINGSDLIPGLDKLAKDITRYYDRENPVDNPILYEQAHNLYGYRPRDYMDDLGASPVIQTDYHRAMLKYKGTSLPLAAYSSGMESTIQSDTYHSEVWAWKEGEFGENGNIRRCSFKVHENEVLNQLQIVEFRNEDKDDGAITVSPLDRDNVASDTRWIQPPKSGNFSFEFVDGHPRVEDLYHSLSISDGERPLARFFHYDPLLGLHDPSVFHEIDIQDTSDPAIYNWPFDQNNHWTKDHVGTYWYDTSKVEYENYREGTPQERLSKWGKIKSVHVNETYLDGMALVCKVDSHWFQEDQAVHFLSSEGAYFTAYVGEVDETTVRLLSGDVDDPDALILNDTTGILASGVDWISDRKIQVWEWVESKYSPEDYTTYDPDNGIPYSKENYSFVLDEVGVPTFYYWVRGRKVTPSGKHISASEIEKRLTGPSQYSNWFAPLTENTFVFNSEMVRGEDYLEFLLITNDKLSNLHSQWRMASENSFTEKVPPVIVNKLIDSLFEDDA